MTQTTSPNQHPSEPHPLVRIANLEAKFAQLEQRLEKLEGLQVLKSSPLPPQPVVSFSEKTTDNVNLFEIVSIDTRIIETNDSWSKIAWKLVIKNLTDTALAFNAYIEFLDEDGFLIDDTLEPNLLLFARNEQAYTGNTLIDASLIGNVVTVQAKVRPS